MNIINTTHVMIWVPIPVGYLKYFEKTLKKYESAPKSKKMCTKKSIKVPSKYPIVFLNLLGFANYVQIKMLYF